MILGVGVVASDPLVVDVRDYRAAVVVVVDADDAEKDKDVVVADGLGRSNFDRGQIH